MPKSPPIPKEQRSFRGARTNLTDQALHPHDDNAYNTAERGQSGNMRQNMTNQRKMQDR